MDTSTGIDPANSEDGSDVEDDENDRAKWQRSPSPSSSVSHLAASFVQRVNDFVGGGRSTKSLTDAELEAEAERERDRSRREAEAILTREAQQRKLVEERVLAMLENTRPLPPPPSRSQTTPNPPSPAGSQKSETSWWSTAKNKLTPTKELLTPAQQIIQEAKAREKEKDKKGKGKEKEKEWPANAQIKYNDPAFANLNLPAAPLQRKPVPASPSSPTPSRPSLSNMPPNLTPSPMRGTDTASASPSREAPPMYAEFNAQGALDVPGTLLAIAKRFEKLEKWTVGHVRALEDRMNDVERWLVDKEKEKTEAKETKLPDTQQELQEMREEMSELQGRFGELGREMAKLATAPANLSSGPKAQYTSVVPPSHNTSSVLVQNNTGSSIPSTPHHRRISTSATDSTSPPLASNKTPSGTRLPYPQGDYTSPPDAFSPPSSPPGSLNAARRTQLITIPGLPNPGPISSLSTSYSTSSFSSVSSYGRTMSPSPMPGTVITAVAPGRATSPMTSGLPAPKPTSQRQNSVSPTPRKRYTVALGGPIVAPEDLASNAAAAPSTSADEDWFGEETVGKSLGLRLASSTGAASASASPMPGSAGAGDYKSAASTSPSPMSTRRMRAQSAYGFSSVAGAGGTTAAAVLNSGGALPSVAPLRMTKTRSKSTERLGGSGTGDGFVGGLTSATGAKFVDPLVLRKQSRDSLMKPIAMPKPVGKVPIGQLVAFFDKDKDKK